MRIEPTFDHNLLIDVLRHSYGLSVEQLTFVPKGEVAYSYTVTCTDGIQDYLKVLDDTRLACTSASRFDFYLPLTDKLYAEGVFRYLSHPIRTLDGALYTAFDGQPLILFNFIDGENPDEATLHTPAVWQRLARHVATIHNSVSRVAADCPYTETFVIPFETALLDGLYALDSITESDGEGRLALRDLLLPHQKAILGYLAQLHALAERARVLNPPLVLCHTDIHRMNLLLNATGDLYILDWEGAMLAPREHDLFMFTGDHFPAFLAEYRRWVDSAPLHAELFGFYFYRRNLEDLTTGSCVSSTITPMKRRIGSIWRGSRKTACRLGRF
jgi:spectinomycin phosphotransferase